MMPQRTFLMMLIVVCVTILCFVWMVRIRFADSGSSRETQCLWQR